MRVTSDINKISVKSSVKISQVNMTTLLFIDNLIVSKTRYSLTNRYINILDSATESISLYHNLNSCEYYEFQVDLNQTNTTIAGMDRFRNILNNLSNKGIIVFVNGYKLLPNEFQVVSDRSIIIFPKYVSERISTVIIYVSDKLKYCGEVFGEETWNPAVNEFELYDYDKNRYLFFKNGQQIEYDLIEKVGTYVKINTICKESDIIEYYQLPNDTNSYVFVGVPGYLSYGPEDKHKRVLPVLSNAVVHFERTVRLLVDSIREGFFLNENDGTGSLIILDNDFDALDLNAIIISPFTKTNYLYDEYYLQVPEATSILKYTSEFDLGGKLFPEILGIFQRVLLDETYDSLQRLKNIRNSTKIDSTNLSALINFLGLNIKINNITAEQKRRLIDELNNFYNIVGTKASYNFYNFVTEKSTMVKMDQLFTPIKDVNDVANPLQRYVDFRTAEELGAEYKREYRINTTDYGYVDEIANLTDTLNNTPRSEGVLQNPNKAYNPQGIRIVYVVNDKGEIVETYKNVTPNPYIVQPTPGPNQAVIDYGWITPLNDEMTAFEDPTSFIDYGLVTDEIKGEWVEWFEWTRDTDWYPTNHVDISISLPAEVDYDEFIKFFMKTFYNIASTVLYIHSIVQVYDFGPSNAESNTGKVNIMTSPIYVTGEYTFTSEPTRQCDKYWLTTTNPNWVVPNQTYMVYDLVKDEWFKPDYPDISETDVYQLTKYCLSMKRTRLDLYKINRGLDVYVDSINSAGLISALNMANPFGIIDYTYLNEIEISTKLDDNSIHKATIEFKCLKVADVTENQPAIYSYRAIRVLRCDTGFKKGKIYNVDIPVNYEEDFKEYSINDKCDAIVFHDIDYVTFAYVMTPGHGHHLDTFTRIVNSKNPNYNIAVGHYTGDHALIPYSSATISSWSSEMDYDPNALVQWCRHNQGTHEGSPYYYTTENVIINVNSFKNDLYKDNFDDIIIFDLYCAYLGSVSGVTSSEDVKIVIKGYKNGRVVKYNHTQVNEHDIYVFDNVDEQGISREPEYPPLELPLQNMWIESTLGGTTSVYDIPEESTRSDIKQKLRKVARITYEQSTKNVTFEIIPNQDS